jgi:hypothetical protein
MKGIKRASKSAAHDVCNAIDAALGYPKIEQEIGPPVLTERWTVPIELADGSWFVQCDSEKASKAKKTAVETVDVGLIKQKPEVP